MSRDSIGETPSGSERATLLVTGLDLLHANEFDQAISLFTAESARAAADFPLREAYAKHAEAQLGLVCCYSVVHNRRELKRAKLQCLASVRKAYDREEDFALFPILECSIHIQDFSSRYSRIIGTIGTRTSEEILASVDKFVEANSGTLSLSGEIWCASLLYKMKRDKECAKRIERFAALYPNSAVTIEHKLAQCIESAPEEAVKLMKILKSLVGGNSEIYLMKAALSYKLRDQYRTIRYCTKSLNLKISKYSLIYILFFFSSLSLFGWMQVKFLNIFDLAIAQRPAVLLNVCEMCLPNMVKNLDVYANRLNFFLRRCVGLCHFGLRAFDKAIENFQQACDPTLAQRVRAELNDTPSPDNWFESFGNLIRECEAKIVECRVAKARHARAAMVIRRAATEVMYRPGGPGYLSAFENFRLLAAAR